MWSLAKSAGGVLHTGLPLNKWEWPSTVTYAIALRQKYDSFLELPEIPPEEHWDFPFLIKKHIESLYPSAKGKTTADVNVDDIE